MYLFLDHSSKLFAAWKWTARDKPATIFIISDVTSIAVQDADAGREKGNRKSL